MDSALIVSAADAASAKLTEMLTQASIARVSAVNTAGEARRLLALSDFDLYVINSPIADEAAEKLAHDLTDRMAGEVMVLVKEDKFYEASDRMSAYGIITVSKPLNRMSFWSALKMAEASHNRFIMMRRENMKLQQKIEDIKIINRAKLVLVSRLSMTEPEAHKYIEKQAMDMRVTRRAVADGILKVHEG
ncbi:MAG: ANTAR domain-containing protein [Oscillospiraceae bacterium]|nr:ANTAR domain-containing protein [Oscillospiraceae bacterium]